MKKVLSIVLICAICVCCVSCGGAAPSITERGEEVIALIGEIAASDDYLDVMTGNMSAYEKLLAEVRAVDYSEISAVYELELSREQLFLKLYGIHLGMDELSEAVENKLTDGLGSELATHINSKDKMPAAVVSTVYTASKTFVDKSIEENRYLLYTLEGGYPVLVSFMPGEDGAVYATAKMILSSSFEATDAEQISSSFAKMGFDGINVTKVK